ncbi:14303_t:CDS:2, partial [Entrophospora sp. SA101]
MGSHLQKTENKAGGSGVSRIHLRSVVSMKKEVEKAASSFKVEEAGLLGRSNKTILEE